MTNTDDYRFWDQITSDYPGGTGEPDWPDWYVPANPEDGRWAWAGMLVCLVSALIVAWQLVKLIRILS